MKPLPPVNKNFMVAPEAEKRETSLSQVGDGPIYVLRW